jgi:hypothetical protein
VLRIVFKELVWWRSERGEVFGENFQALARSEGLERG